MDRKTRIAIAALLILAVLAVMVATRIDGADLASTSPVNTPTATPPFAQTLHWLPYVARQFLTATAPVPTVGPTATPTQTPTVTNTAYVVTLTAPTLTPTPTTP